jgi:hypothetical protein
MQSVPRPLRASFAVAIASLLALVEASVKSTVKPDPRGLGSY